MGRPVLLWLAVLTSILSSHLTAQSTVPAGDVRWENLPDTDTVFTAAKFEGLDAWQTKQEWLRQQVRVAAGLWPEPERTPLNARVFGKLERDGYTVEKVYFESYPGFYVTGNLYRPRPVQGVAATEHRLETGATPDRRDANSVRHLCRSVLTQS